MKPQTYDGTSDWLDYLAHFERVAEYNGWDAYEKLAWLGGSLRGEAMGTLVRLDEIEEESYSSLVHFLNVRFGLDAKVSQLMLAKRVRKADEPLTQLANNIRRLVKRAYPTGRDIWETLAVQYFSDAILDYDINYQICVSNPETLDEALLIASSIENFRIIHKLREERYGGFSKPMNEGQSESEQVNDNDQSCCRSDVAKAVGRVVKEYMQEFSEDLIKVNSQKFGSLEERNGMRKPVSARKKMGVVCFNCDKAGHIAKVCPWFMKGTKNKVDSGNKIVEYKHDKVRSCKVSTKTKPRCDKVGGINTRQVVVTKVNKDVEVKVEKEGVELALQKRKSPSRQARAWKVESSG